MKNGKEGRSERILLKSSKDELIDRTPSRDTGYRAILLISSLVFYSLLNGNHICILILVAFSDYCLGLGINLNRNQKLRKLLLIFSVTIDLSVLLFFKYFGLLIETCSELIIKLIKYCQLLFENADFWFSGSNGTFEGNGFGIIGAISTVTSPTWISEIVLPLGISFFIFQSMSYTIDVYRSVIRPETSFFRYLLYISFFPQLVAGPIVKAKEFLPQLLKRISWSEIPLAAIFGWIFLGIFKKAVLADRIAEISDTIYKYPDAVSSSFTWFGVFSYSLQIYLDFSGYTDIAIGLALLFGFRLSKNFDMPYTSSTITDFWNRWHISLSSWLRDYLYIPLGGNRISRWITFRNLFIVMMLGGIWHGASWNFLVWGCIHGILLAIERYFQWKDRVNQFNRFTKGILSIVVFCAVSFLWILFRSPDWNTTDQIINNLFANRSGLNIPYSMRLDLFWVSAICLIGHYLGATKRHPSYWMEKKFTYLHSIVAAFVLIAFVLLSADTKPFIYFVF
ncbi:MBOAT family O-acyltransferase [Leptospira sp. GIMC2001]|uniref:MBOAT family O-acyltransferase n=1 Tax=Leptospira sp. GIMC2001 TaxID=1513297 RepID=UPI00234A25BC|nr:MBOAT family O-acyltransferase [Leptospira sp. GIMC2001]WCL47669.1 MBOAT family protein [Leptospira sp. GIMC2001]